MTNILTLYSGMVVDLQNLRTCLQCSLAISPIILLMNLSINSKPLSKEKLIQVLVVFYQNIIYSNCELGLEDPGFFQETKRFNISRVPLFCFSFGGCRGKNCCYVRINGYIEKSREIYLGFLAERVKMEP